MRIELYIPEPALYERGEHWIRERLSEIEAAGGKADSVQKAVKMFVQTPVRFQAPSEQELRSGYARIEEQAIQALDVKTCPSGSFTLDDAFRLAVARDFTFEQKGSGVVGLQDCVILASALHHLQHNPVSAAFVSNDAVFSRLARLAPTYGVDLRLISGTDELEKILDRAHDAEWGPVIREWWSREDQQIRALILDQTAQIETFIEQNIDRSAIQKRVVGTVLSIGPPKLESVGGVRPEAKGEAAEPIQFSCDLHVSYEVVVERSPLSLGALLHLQYVVTGGPPTQSTGGSPIQATEKTTAIVELTARVNPEHTELTLDGVQMRE
jgi:hypothetical protein